MASYSPPVPPLLFYSPTIRNHHISAAKFETLAEFQIPGRDSYRSLRILWSRTHRSVSIGVTAGDSIDPVAWWDGEALLFHTPCGSRRSSDIRLNELHDVGPLTDEHILCWYTLRESSPHYQDLRPEFDSLLGSPLWREILDSCPRLAAAASVMFE